eukprot:EG_transcript_21069
MPLLAGGEAGFRDGPVAQARFRNPALLAVDSNGDLFIGDLGNNRIRKLTLADEVTTVAGSGQLGWRDGPVLEAQFRTMGSFSLDPRRPGALVAVEFLLHCILYIDLAGVVAVIAGLPGCSGHIDGPVHLARFMNPSFVHVGPAGDVFVVDRGNHCLRRIDAEGRTVTTLAGGRPGMRDGFATEAQFRSPTFFAIDVDGTLWVTDTENHAIRRVDSDGCVTTVAGNGTRGYVDGQGAEARFNTPTSIVLDHNGNLVVADTKNHCIRNVTHDGHVSTLLSPAPAP